MSVAWSVRGQFGHAPGAMIPGVIAAAAVALMAPDVRWHRAFGWSLMFSMIGFAIGGHLGYQDAIAEILARPTLRDALPGLGHIFGLGAVWGGLGLTALGVGLSEHPLRFRELALCAAIAAGWFVALRLYHREAAAIVFFGAGLAALHCYNALVFRSQSVTLFGLAGVLGFGGGFVFAVLLLYGGSRGWFGHWAWWNFRDQWIGAIGGLATAWAASAVRRRELVPHHTHLSRLSHVAGLVYFLIGVPAVETLNILISWAEERPVPVHIQQAFLAALAVCWLVAAVWICRSACHPLTDHRAWKVVRAATIAFLWLISALAIAKETIPIGWHRWEPAFTMDVICSLLVTIVLVVPQATPIALRAAHDQRI